MSNLHQVIRNLNKKQVAEARIFSLWGYKLGEDNGTKRQIRHLLNYWVKQSEEERENLLDEIMKIVEAR